MTITNIITAICFGFFTLAVIYVIINMLLKKRPERIAFIRSFKKGKCAAIFIIAVPLLALAYLYDGLSVVGSIFTAVTHTVGLVILKFNLDDIQGLMGANLFYAATVYYCCFLVSVNAVLFALSLTSQRLWQFLQKLKNKRTKKDKLYIFGYNENSLAVYYSDKTRNCMIVDKISDADCTSMYIAKTSFISCRAYNDVVEFIFKSLMTKNNKITVVINTENDEKNLQLGCMFTEKISAADAKLRERICSLLSIYIFGNPKHEAIYDDMVSGSAGCMHYKNKYRMIATSFVDKYPFTKFMDERHIDYKTALIKPEVDINVCMIGFGKPNRQIFLTSVANNQFITATDNGIGLKCVNYHIFDKAHAENNKNLNHSYYRYRDECAEVDPDDYLPLPEFPAKEQYYHIDINDSAFYNTIREVVTAKSTDVNFIVISFEGDLENIDMAQKLLAKRREWGLENLVIFVRVKAPHDKYSFFAEDNVILIGDENKTVYDIAEITEDKISRMAKMRHEVYNLEYEITSNAGFVLNEQTVAQNRAESTKGWFGMSRWQRESNTYCCLSLQSKLNLMGLMYCGADENDAPAMTEAEYMNYYAETDLPDTHSYTSDIDGKKIVKYTLNFPESKRKNLAVLEHLRWNSFMISQGMIPASKEQILHEQINRGGKLRYTNGKNYMLRRHGNLTTFDGLVEFRQMLAARDGNSEADYDVIKYDYQLLDDAYWLLSKNGYKIVKRA